MVATATLEQATPKVELKVLADNDPSSIDLASNSNVTFPVLSLDSNQVLIVSGSQATYDAMTSEIESGNHPFYEFIPGQKALLALLSQRLENSGDNEEEHIKIKKQISQRLRALTASFQIIRSENPHSSTPNLERQLQDLVISQRNVSTTAALSYHGAYTQFARKERTPARRVDVNNRVNYAEDVITKAQQYLDEQNVRPEDRSEMVSDPDGEIKRTAQEIINPETQSKYLNKLTGEIILSEVPFNLLPDRYINGNLSSAEDSMLILQAFLGAGVVPEGFKRDSGKPNLGAIAVRCKRLQDRTSIKLAGDTEIKNWVFKLNAALYESWSSQGQSNPLFKLENYQQFKDVADNGIGPENKSMSAETKFQLLQNYILYLLDYEDQSTHTAQSYLARLVNQQVRLKPKLSPSDIDQSLSSSRTHLHIIHSFIAKENITTLSQLTASESTDQDSAEDNITLKLLDQVIETMKAEAKFELKKDEFMMGQFLARQLPTISQS